MENEEELQQRQQHAAPRIRVWLQGSPRKGKPCGGVGVLQTHQEVELCPRALAVLKHQFALCEQYVRYVRAGKIKHDFVFFRDDGQPMRTLKDAYMRWRHTIEKLNVRYREPYNARHSCVSWNLMMGKNLMWVARQHGHSVQVMLSMYGACRQTAAPRPLDLVRPRWFISESAVPQRHNDF
jgi:integrase